MSEVSNFPLPGDEFVGRYVIEKIIGAGGFSRVYLATQKGVDRPVAIKVLDPEIRGRISEAEKDRKLQLVVKRFEREAKLVSKLRDPHTTVMHDYGRTDWGLLYIVLEYVDGITIGELIRRSGKIPAKRVAKILKQALSSLQEAHAFGVLHRDIKPQNIMVYEHIGRLDQVKVLDFGIAKAVSASAQKASTSELTGDGILIGTPRYMSPEQIRGEHDLGPASDIYSLGLVAYEMLTGAKAVAADSSMKIIAKHLDPSPIEIPQGLEAPAGMVSIINKMLEKDFTRRFQNCDVVLAQLENWDAPGAPMARDTIVDPRHAPTALMLPEAVTIPVPIRIPTGTMDMDLSSAFQHRGNRGLLAGIVVIVLLILGLLIYKQTGDSDPVSQIENNREALSQNEEVLANLVPQELGSEAGDMGQADAEIDLETEVVVELEKTKPKEKLATRPSKSKKRATKKRRSPKKPVAVSPEKGQNEPVKTETKKKGFFIRPLDRRND